MQIPMGKPRKCPVCSEQLSSGRALGGHMSRHTAAKQRRAATIASRAKKCPICGEAMGSGRAIGGHMSKHSRGAAAKGLTPEARERLKEVQQRIGTGIAAGNVTVDMGKNGTPRAAMDIRAAAKAKRAEATSHLAQAKTKRDEADELDRLAERIEHLL